MGNNNILITHTEPHVRLCFTSQHTKENETMKRKTTLEQINSMSDHKGKQILLDSLPDIQSMIVVDNDLLPERYRQYKQSDISNRFNPDTQSFLSYGRTLSELETLRSKFDQIDVENDLANFETRSKEIRLESYIDNAENIKPVLVDNDRLYAAQIRFANAIGLFDE